MLLTVMIRQIAQLSDDNDSSGSESSDADNNPVRAARFVVPTLFFPLHCSLLRTVILVFFN